MDIDWHQTRRRDLLVEELKVYAKAPAQPSKAERARRLARMPVTRSLPGVRAAGAEELAIWQYIGQAVRVACESAGGNATAGRVSPGPSAAAKALFGLTAEASGLSWRERQSRAADLLCLSWDHFRRRPQEELLYAVVACLLETNDPATRDPRPVANPRPDQPQSATPLVAHVNQSMIEDDLVEYIRRTRPPAADLLEFSSFSINRVLQALRDADTTVRLLLHHPDADVSDWQRRRMLGQVANLRDLVFKGSKRLDVRFYRTPPSLRGRHIGDRIVVGWYTFRDDRSLALDDPDQVQLYGHDNLVIAGAADSREALHLTTWFDGAFSEAWDHRSTTIDNRLFPRRR